MRHLRYSCSVAASTKRENEGETVTFPNDSSSKLADMTDVSDAAAIAIRIADSRNSGLHSSLLTQLREK